MDPRIEIVLADGTSEHFVIDREQMVLGRSLEANISIPDARDLQAEHLMLKPQATGCWVAVAQGSETPALVSGRPFESGVLPWGTEIQIGSLVVVLTGFDTGTKKNPLGPWVLGLAILAVGFGSYVWYVSRDPLAQITAPKNYPDIMPPPMACRVEGPAAASRGKAALDAAVAKSDRYPFDPQDGIQALSLFSESLACFQAVGDASQAARASREGRTMQIRVDEDYRTRRLALELALQNQNPELAMEELSQLYQLVEHTNTEYKASLRSIAAVLSLQLAKKKVGGGS